MNNIMLTISFLSPDEVEPLIVSQSKGSLATWLKKCPLFLFLLYLWRPLSAILSTTGVPSMVCS